MSIIKKTFIGILAVGCLAGCNEKLTYAYLMQHPDVLKAEIQRCESLSINQRTSENSAQCKIVANAANDMLIFISAQQQDPQEFGQKILDLQMAFAKSAQQLADAEQAVAALKTKNASSPELQTANEKLTQVQNTYENQRQQINAMLAVVGLNSPE